MMSKKEFMTMSYEFVVEAKKRSIDFWANVPCSILNPFLYQIGTHPGMRSINACSEGEAVAIAAGAWLAGRAGGIIIQNSGLGNAVNPLTSLCQPFKIPLNIVLSWRGYPSAPDEPQHLFMGEITESLLTMMGIRSFHYSDYSSSISTLFDRLETERSLLRLTAVLVKDGDLNSEKRFVESNFNLHKGKKINFVDSSSRHSRIQMLEAIASELDPCDLVVASTGKLSRELFVVADAENKFYQVGSMGCASAIGLGVSLNTNLRTVVLDGDGALLMKMGNLSTIGRYGGRNYIHILFNNGGYDSTGGQESAGKFVSFSDIALACGYRKVIKCSTPHSLRESYSIAKDCDGPSFIEIPINRGSIPNLPRPSIKPTEVAERFRKFIEVCHG